MKEKKMKKNEKNIIIWQCFHIMLEVLSPENVLYPAFEYIRPSIFVPNVVFFPLLSRNMKNISHNKKAWQCLMGSQTSYTFYFLVHVPSYSFWSLFLSLFLSIHRFAIFKSIYFIIIILSKIYHK